MWACGARKRCEHGVRGCHGRRARGSHGVIQDTALCAMPHSIDSQRLHLWPMDRIATVATMAATVGAAQGFYEGIKISSLRYLTENAHRLPRTVGGWYFYHKKKNYTMLTTGLAHACRKGLKYSAGISTFLALEAGLDAVRGTTDFLNTCLVGTLCAYGIGTSKHMSRVQKLKYVRKGSLLAMALGLSQDLMIYWRGGYVWYAKDTATAANAYVL